MLYSYILPCPGQVHECGAVLQDRQADAGPASGTPSESQGHHRAEHKGGDGRLAQGYGCKDFSKTKMYIPLSNGTYTEVDLECLGVSFN